MRWRTVSTSITRNCDVRYHSWLDAILWAMGVVLIALSLGGVLGYAIGHATARPADHTIQQARVHASDVCHANGEKAVVDILDDGTVDWMCYH
jgi:hypothetical protein